MSSSSETERLGASPSVARSMDSDCIPPIRVSSVGATAVSENGNGRLHRHLRPQRRSAKLGHALRLARTALPLILADLLAVGLALLASGLVTNWFFADLQYTRLNKQSLTLLAIACLVYPKFGLYPGSGMNPILEFRQLVVSTSFAYLLLLIVNACFGRLSPYEMAFIVTAWFITLLLLTLGRRLARSAASKFRWWGQPALVIGGGEQGARIYRALEAMPTLGLRPAGIVDIHRDWSAEADELPPYLGPMSNLAGICERYDAQWAIVATSAYSDKELPQIFDYCAWCIPNLVVVPNIEGVPSLWSRVQECAGQPGIHVQARLLLTMPRLLKRSMDIVLVLVGGILILPFIGLISLLIYLSSPGPIFYPHLRIGMNGRSFRAWKFRTMVPNADKMLAEWLRRNPEARREWERDHKLKNDPRIIPRIGYYLRLFSLDELPQLWNVLRGEMSLVGPRPIVMEEVEKYAGNFHLYLKVPPGLTGLWQVSGRNNTTYEERVRLDTYYVRNWSPWLDIYILVRTIKTVLLHEGAF